MFEVKRNRHESPVTYRNDMMITENELQTGDILGGFKIEKELGRGGMGVVFKAHELSLNRKIALKVLSARLSSNKEFIQRFKREAQVIAALKHPNIVSVLSYGEDQGLHYFAMEYVSGKDLGEILTEKKVIESEMSLAIVRQVADALAEAGAKGVVHRDIKPSNIMIDPANRAYVTDFGVAHFAETSEKLTRTGLFLGTPEYASPEQATGRSLDVRSDIYSLGAVLYRMISGQAPVTAESPLAIVAKISTEPVTPISDINPSVPGPLCELVGKMMAKDLHARYQSPEELIEAIDKCSQMLKADRTIVPSRTHISHGKDQETFRTEKKRSYIGVLGGIAGIALSVLIIVWLVEGGGHIKKGREDSLKAISSDENKAVIEVEANPPPVSMPLDVPQIETKTKANESAHDEIAAADKDAGKAVSANVDGGLLLPETPTILVIISGDESILPSARSHLHSAIKNRGLKTLTFTEIPQLKNKMQWAGTSMSWYDIKQLTPQEKAQILVLAEVTKTGSMPIQYMGRSENLTVASFSLQTIDLETGQLVYSTTSEAIKFSVLNMEDKLEAGIESATQGIETEILQYWGKKRTS